MWKRFGRSLFGCACGGLFVNMAFGADVARTGDMFLEKPPETRRDDMREVIHGVEVSDPYRWLEDRTSPQTEAWIKAQNEYTEAVLHSLPRREEVKQRLTELMKVDSVGLPWVRNGRYFLVKRDREQELSVISVRNGLRGKEEVLLDPHPLSPDHTTSVAMLDITEDGTLMAYSVREGGQDEVTIKFLDVERKEILPESLPKARYFDCCLAPDKRGAYYSRHGEEGTRIYYHPLAVRARAAERRAPSAGPPPTHGRERGQAMGKGREGDRQIFGEGYGPDKGIGVDLSDDGRYLLLTVWHGSAAEKTEVYFADLAEGGPIVPVANDIDARFTGEIGGESLFLHTNWKAPKGRILRIDLRKPARENWREVVPETDAVIDGFSLGGGRLFVNYLENVKSRVRVFEADGRRVEDIAFPAMGSISGIGGRWASDEAFFMFSSFHIPSTIYRYELPSGRQEVWWRLQVPMDSDSLEVEQVWYKSKDGTRVPMFLVHGKGLHRNGSNPALLTGYGGFNATLTPWFSPIAAIWAENGGVFAVANLRGGGEFGEEWHRAGIRENKQNVFDDFLAAAEWLIANGYTRPEKLAISGGSNGGLLVGAALAQRPELFRAIVCTYPLLDMVRYHKFLLARFWVPEYGSSEDSEQFKYLHAYSPYHRVQKGTKYPAVLFITGDEDTRVDPLHARKMTALLQASTASNRPILLQYETKAGHSGGRPLSKQIEDLTDELVFLFYQLGVNPAVR